jgi:hypothetical protein
VSYTPEDLREMIALRAGAERMPARIRVVTNTTDFFRVDYDDVLILEGRPFLIRNYEREGRFGLEDEPKFWVRKSVDLTDGSVKIIKMVFHERFTRRFGGFRYECVRSPGKEARVLDLVRGRRRFMQGHSVEDSAGNNVRVIDYIKGRPLSSHVLGLGRDHEDYYFGYFPRVLEEYIEMVKAVGFLHGHGETHGDIRRDHIIRERDSGECFWIDFDFDCFHEENMFGHDLAGLGNVLIYLAGRGDVTVQELKKAGSHALDRLSTDDMNIVFRNRVANLKKVYPYVSDALNVVMSHFSGGANIYYDNIEDLTADLIEAREGF